MVISQEIYSKYAKIAAAGGITTVVASAFLEYYHLKQLLNRLVNTGALDADKNRPDYIYIKYSIYRKTMAERQFDRHWVSVIVQPFGKWWKTLKHSIAWRLLEVAKSGDPHERKKAIKTLAQIERLKDWDYQHLAQTCDAKTAISLARHECDLRWFVPPRGRGLVRAPKSLIKEMQRYMKGLNDCECVKHLRHNVLSDFGIVQTYIDQKEHKPINQRSITPQEFQFIIQCLHVFFHVSRDLKQAHKLIDRGFLQTLIEVQKLFNSNTEVSFLLAKILSNLSLCPGMAEHFFVTGWVGRLATMSRHPDLRVQVTAAKALSNMDESDRNHCHYTSRVYPLYPKFHSHQKPEVDIVFVHGLLGGVFVTWRQKDRDPSQVGVLGKTTFNDTQDEKEAQTQHRIADYNRNGARNWRRINTTAANRETNETKVEPAASGQQPVNVDDESLVSTTADIQLVGRSRAKRGYLRVSDEATNDLLETLENASDITPDWEVVYADCPLKASSDASGPFSESGDDWRYEDTEEEYSYCWPMDWLPTDYPSARILGLNYETAISEWYTDYHANCPCQKTGTLHNRSAAMLDELAASGAGQNGRPIVWVVHSMGGLIAKSIIIQAAKSDNPAIRQIADQSQGILFLGTPHRGSLVAKLRQHTQLIVAPTVEVKELVGNNSYLLELQAKFEDYLATRKKSMHIVSMSEGLPTKISAFNIPVKIVEEESSRIPNGDHYVLNVDHLCLSKPVVRHSFLYQRLLGMIDAIVPAEPKHLLPSFIRRYHREVYD